MQSLFTLIKYLHEMKILLNVIDIESFLLIFTKLPMHNIYLDKNYFARKENVKAILKLFLL